jgi:predicted transcriptional regulator
MLLVTDDNEALVGIVTKTDILRSLESGRREIVHTAPAAV